MLLVGARIDSENKNNKLLGAQARRVKSIQVRVLLVMHAKSQREGIFRREHLVYEC